MVTVIAVTAIIVKNEIKNKAKREVITIAFNEEQGQENEELENVNTSADEKMSDDKKEKIDEAKDKIKEKLKDKKVRTFILSHLVPILIVIAIILFIIILIGQFAFLTTMPGMILEKIKEFGRSVWGDFVGFFTGDTVTASVSKEDVVELAQYIQNMGYDIESCGFGKTVYKEADEDDLSTTKQLEKIGESVDGKEYLKAYIASNESTYVLSSFSLNGFLQEQGSKIVAFVKNDPTQVVNNEEVSTGMINILGTSYGEPMEKYVKIDRENEKMTVYTDAIYLPIVGTFTDEMGLTENGSIQWGSMFSYDLSTWTSKYGKPLELFLSVHLSTMMPDLSYRIAKDQELNTKVNVVLQDINVKYDTSVKSVGDNTANITKEQIVNAFLEYGLSGQKYQYTEEVEVEDDEAESSEEQNTLNNSTSEQTTTETVTKEVNFFDEIKKSLTTQEERNQLFRNIIQMASDNFLSDSFGINIANALINDNEGNAIINLLKKCGNNLLSLAQRLFNGGDSEYIVYIKKGEEEVPGLNGITYDDLFELADITAQGLEDGIDRVKWPYIQSVTNHWYYNDIDFSKGVYRKATTAKKKILYESADEENSALSKHNIEVELDATLTADEGIVYQVCEPEATGPNRHILEIFSDKYYKYDGTVETAKKIENAKLYEKYGTESIGQDVTYNGEKHTIEEPTVEKEEVSFEENKADALTAFSILENMHSEEAEFAYRNLKDLVINLGYFNKDELTSDLKNAMLWLIKSNNKNEEFEVEKDANEYGMVIKGVNGREVIAPENCKVSVDDEGVVTLKFKKMSDETVELLKYIYEKDYKNINPDILVGLTMKIKGLENVKTGIAKRGETIGTATSELNVVMFDIDKSIIENIEEYMVQEHNNIYEENMKDKMTRIYQEGIDIGRIDEDGYYENSAVSTGHGTWSYNPSDFDLLCAITASEDNGSYEGALAVITTACNRTESAKWKSKGSDPLSQYRAKGQFSGYLDGYYIKWLNGKYPDYVKQAVEDAVQKGIRNHKYGSFRANYAQGREQIGAGGNWYFDVIV